jgi:hypothetical protein
MCNSSNIYVSPFINHFILSRVVTYKLMEYYIPPGFSRRAMKGYKQRLSDDNTSILFISQVLMKSFRFPTRSSFLESPHFQSIDLIFVPKILRNSNGQGPFPESHFVLSLAISCFKKMTREDAFQIYLFLLSFYLEAKNC